MGVVLVPSVINLYYNNNNNNMTYDILTYTKMPLYAIQQLLGISFCDPAQSIYIVGSYTSMNIIQNSK